MPVVSKRITLATKKQFEIIDITQQVQSVVEESHASEGLIHVFTPHSTASIRLNHMEPLLLQDIMKMMYHLVPIDNNYAHDFFEIRTQVSSVERSNGHAHLKAFLLGSSETIPLAGKKMLLGPRQSIFFIELDGARERSVQVTVWTA